jgi:hypothetical protein
MSVIYMSVDESAGLCIAAPARLLNEHAAFSVRRARPFVTSAVRFVTLPFTKHPARVYILAFRFSRRRPAPTESVNMQSVLAASPDGPQAFSGAGVAVTRKHIRNGSRR